MGELRSHFKLPTTVWSVAFRWRVVFCGVVCSAIRWDTSFKWSEVVLYESKSSPWNALDALRPLTAASLTLSARERVENQQYFWEDLCSEYDAENLCLE